MDTKKALKAWNKEVFGRIQTNITETKGKIQKIQNGGANRRLNIQETILNKELDNQLKYEEMMWRDKAKSK